MISRISSALLCAILLLHCQHEAAPPQLFVALGDGPAPPLQLGQIELNSMQASNTLIDSLLLLGAEDDVTAMLLTTAGQISAAQMKANPSTRLWIAQSVYRRVRAPGFSSRFDAIRKIVDTLQSAAPDCAEAAFCRAFLRWVLMADGKGGLQLAGLDRQIAVDLQRDLRAIVEKHPAFDGPGDFTHKRLIAELAAVNALLAQPIAPLAASPTEVAAPAAITPSLLDGRRKLP